MPLVEVEQGNCLHLKAWALCHLQQNDVVMSGGWGSGCRRSLSPKRNAWGRPAQAWHVECDLCITGRTNTRCISCSTFAKLTLVTTCCDSTSKVWLPQASLGPRIGGLFAQSCSNRTELRKKVGWSLFQGPKLLRSPRSM